MLVAGALERCQPQESHLCVVLVQDIYPLLGVHIPPYPTHPFCLTQIRTSRFWVKPDACRLQTGVAAYIENLDRLFTENLRTTRRRFIAASPAFSPCSSARGCPWPARTTPPLGGVPPTPYLPRQYIDDGATSQLRRNRITPGLRVVRRSHNMLWAQNIVGVWLLPIASP